LRVQRDGCGDGDAAVGVFEFAEETTREFLHFLGIEVFRFFRKGGGDFVEGHLELALGELVIAGFHHEEEEGFDFVDIGLRTNGELEETELEGVEDDGIHGIARCIVRWNESLHFMGATLAGDERVAAFGMLPIDESIAGEGEAEAFGSGPGALFCDFVELFGEEPKSEAVVFEWREGGKEQVVLGGG